jgi:hypothetical protein
MSSKRLARTRRTTSRPMSSSPSPQLQAVLDLIDSANAQDWSRAAALLSHDFVQEVLPPSVSRPRRTGEEMISTFKESMTLIKDFKVGSSRH